MKPPRKREKPQPEKFADRLLGKTVMILAPDDHFDSKVRIQELLEQRGMNVVLSQATFSTPDSLLELSAGITGSKDPKPAALLIVNPSPYPQSGDMRRFADACVQLSKES